MKKSLPKIIVLAGYGLNCEEETAAAFNLTGGTADIVHINDLIATPKKLSDYQILAIPGGFSYGDDLGSGKAYANKLKNHLGTQLQDFASKDKLIIGICNGFQILTNLGLLPGVLTFNDNNRYTDRWVDVKIQRGTLSHRGAPSCSPWLTGIDSLSLPIAHGEGKFVADETTISSLKRSLRFESDVRQKARVVEGVVNLRRQTPELFNEVDDQIFGFVGGVYYKGQVCNYQNLSPNPNGSTLDIAMLTSKNGKILGTMPHPERGIFFTQIPYWPLEKERLIRAEKSLPKYTDSLQIFKNAINYFK
jgi:phosphoribosylformylglycinamidine (FGAM) synthase-like amidotransferase family enzyme